MKPKSFTIKFTWAITELKLVSVECLNFGFEIIKKLFQMIVKGPRQIFDISLHLNCKRCSGFNLSNNMNQKMTQNDYVVDPAFESFVNKKLQPDPINPAFEMKQ